MRSQKHTLHLPLALVALCCAWLMGWEVWSIPQAHAAQGVVLINSLQENIAFILSYVITGLNFLTWVIFVLLNFLLDPSFIFDIKADGGSSLLEMLQEIWTLSRDLMNVIFAVGLIGAAVYTVITAKKEFIAEHAKNFVMAVVLVNFSWFFPRVILDVANVATATIYGIPSLIDVECAVPDENDQLQPCEAIVDVRFLDSNDSATIEALENSGNNWDCSLSFVCYRKEVLDSQTVGGPSAVLNGLVMNHARLSSLARLARPIETDNDFDAIKAFIIFILREILVLVIHIALFFPLAALAFAFLVRIPILWITIAFMPFMFFGKVVGENFGGGDLPTGKIFSSFLSAAFLPAMTAVPLTVGFILVNAGAKTSNTQLSQIPIPLLDELGNMWQLLWLFIALAVLFEGVFMALSKSSSEIIKSGSAAIQAQGKALGNLVATLPLKARFIPIGEGGQRASIADAANVVNPRRIQESMRFGGQGFLESLRGGLRGRADQEAQLRTQTVAAISNIQDRGISTSVQSAIARLGTARGNDVGTRADEVIQLLRNNNSQLNVSRDNLAQVLENIRNDGRINVPADLITRLRATPLSAGTPPAPTPPPAGGAPGGS